MVDFNFTRHERLVLPRYIIEKIHEWTFTLSVECCANIALENGNIILTNIKEGSVEYDSSGNLLRGSCNYDIYSKIIVHTHPILLYPFPSEQDLTKVIYNKNIYHSLIGCKWGIWIITNNQHIVLPKNRNEYNVYLKQNFIDKLILNTRRFDKTVLEFNEIITNPSLSSIFQELLKQLADHTQLKIELIPWEHMPIPELELIGGFTNLKYYDKYIKYKNKYLQYKNKK